MIKHFCDECGKELSVEELRFSLDMIGKELCSKHSSKRLEDGIKYYVKKFEAPEFSPPSPPLPLYDKQGRSIKYK